MSAAFVKGASTKKGAAATRGLPNNERWCDRESCLYLVREDVGVGDYARHPRVHDNMKREKKLCETLQPATL